MLFGAEPQNSFGTPGKAKRLCQTHVAERNDPKSPLATANGSVMCGGVARDLASAPFTLAPFDRPSALPHWEAVEPRTKLERLI